MALQLIRRGGTISGILIAVESLIALTPWAGGGGGHRELSFEAVFIPQGIQKRRN